MAPIATVRPEWHDLASAQAAHGLPASGQHFVSEEVRKYPQQEVERDQCGAAEYPRGRQASTAWAEFDVRGAERTD